MGTIAETYRAEGRAEGIAQGQSGLLLDLLEQGMQRNLLDQS